MTDDFVLIKSNEAIAAAALRAGCRFYAGYPITPQSEILEYMSTHMEKVGGTFIQGENELASISMVWGAAGAGALAMTSSSGPGYSLMQEGISYLASYNLPAVLVCANRQGSGDGDITPSQECYNLVTRGGGHGDHRQMVFAPASVQEAADLTYRAFEVAQKYRNICIVLTDSAISQMIEKCVLPPAKEHDINSVEWAITGKPRGVKKNRVTNLEREIGFNEYVELQRKNFHEMYQNEQRWEAVQTEDAEIILVAYGISSRVCKSAVTEARAKGMKLGLIRPITLWPYPDKAFEQISESVKAFCTVEMNLSSLMCHDVVNACRHQWPVYSCATAYDIPTVERILACCADIFAGRKAEVEVL